MAMAETKNPLKGGIMQRNMGERRFGRVNWLGLQTLALRETRRFLAVWTQTLAEVFSVTSN